MDNIIEINNLCFNYKDKIVFDKFNLNIERGSFTTIIGENDSGKTTLVKILTGILKYDGQIKINNLNLNKKEINEIRNFIGYVPSDISDSILGDTVLDEINLSNNKLTKEEFDKLIETFEIKDLLYRDPKTLSGGEKQLMSIVSQLVKKPKILILDDAFSMISNLTTDKIFKMLKKYYKENNMTIINVTNDVEETIYGTMIAIISNGKLILNDKKENVLLNEKVFKNLHLSIPFMADLSIKLKYYNLINNLELDMDKMVNKLWK